MLVRPRERGPDREHARDDRDHDGHHVVEQQGRGRDQARERTQVVLADDVGAAAAGYARTVCRYDVTTIAINKAIASEIGIT